MSCHSRFFFPLRFTSVLPAAYSDKWEIPSVDFPSPYRSKQGVHGPCRAHSTAVTSLRETRYQHEKITGEFFQGAPARKPYVRMLPVPCARPRCCLPVNSYIRAPVYRCVRDIRGCMHAVTFETLREEIADTNLRGAKRTQGTPRTKVIRFLLLLTLISAFGSDLDRKANGKLNERMPGKRANTCSESTNTNLGVTWEYRKITKKIYFFN